MSDEERWVPMKENPLYYEISTMGNIRSIGFSNQWGYYRRKKPILLRTHRNNNGYVQVTLSINGKIKLMTVHRLVASNFIDDVEGKEINHINGDKSDNRLSNIEICTRSENMIHAYRTLGITSNAKRAYNACKKAVQCFDLSGKFVAEYQSVRESAKAIGHTHGRISIASRNGSTAFGFKWKYKQ